MQIKPRQRIARTYNLRRTAQRAHQLVQWRRHFKNDARLAVGDKRHVAAELDRVAEALLGVKQNGPANDLPAARPERLREVALATPEFLGVPTPFVFVSAATKIADQKPA